MAYGAGAVALFLLVLVSGLGAPFILLSSFPFLLLGLRKGMHAVLPACLAAGVISVVLSGIYGALFFLGFIALPAVLFLGAVLKRVQGEWQPVGLALADLTIYSALCITGLVLHYSGTEGGLQGLIASTVRQGFADASPNVQAAVELAAGRLQFLVVAVSAWWWILLLYAHAWLAHWALARGRQNVRPSLVLAPFHLPIFWLGALVLAALLSLVPSETGAFLGRILFITFLLPYFLLGISILHSHVKAWPGGGVLLVLFYLIIFSQFWPALAVAGLGIWRQIRTVRVE